MNKGPRALLPLAIIFIFLLITILLLAKPLTNAGFDIMVLSAANIIFFAVTVVSFFIQLRGLRSTNPHVFVRSVTMGMMLKMLVCIVAVFAYVKIAGDDYNKRSVFTSLCLYLVYLMTEVLIVMKMNKKKNA